jgi:hypothetical protein
MGPKGSLGLYVRRPDHLAFDFLVQLLDNFGGRVLWSADA